MQLNNALWQFALNFYQQPLVEQHCLTLQNQYGLSINRLIFACWAGSQGIRLQPERFAGEAQRWQGEISHPLRALRYRVRQMKLDEPELEACYSKLRQAELACEQVELAMLFQQVQEWPVSAPSGALAKQNLSAYLQHKALPMEADITRLLEPLLSACRELSGVNPSD